MDVPRLRSMQWSPRLCLLMITPAGLIMQFFLFLVRPKTNNHDTTKPPIGINVCPYCGAKYAKEMTVCPLDQNALVFK